MFRVSAFQSIVLGSLVARKPWLSAQTGEYDAVVCSQVVHHIELMLVEPPWDSVHTERDQGNN
jgi:hypothetical protein